jgi:putative FmdB family regulatory protein
MPTYEYRCSNGHDFELFQRMSDEAVDTCPECGADAQRLLSAGAGLLFKGDGFYITDSRKDDYKKKAASEKRGSGGAESSESAEKPDKASTDSSKTSSTSSDD